MINDNSILRKVKTQFLIHCFAYGILVLARAQNVVVNCKERYFFGLWSVPHASHHLNLAMLKQSSEVGMHVLVVRVSGLNPRLVGINPINPCCVTLEDSPDVIHRLSEDQLEQKPLSFIPRL